MKDERYREIMDDFGMPDSRSLLTMLRQVVNETKQECLMSKKGNTCVPKLLNHVDIKLYDEGHPNSPKLITDSHDNDSTIAYVTNEEATDTLIEVVDLAYSAGIEFGIKCARRDIKKALGL